MGHQRKTASRVMTRNLAERERRRVRRIPTSHHPSLVAEIGRDGIL
jgi:hypothetical protein